MSKRFRELSLTSERRAGWKRRGSPRRSDGEGFRLPQRSYWLVFVPPGGWGTAPLSGERNAAAAELPRYGAGATYTPLNRPDQNPDRPQ
jgi:hypothetical protein